MARSGKKSQRQPAPTQAPRPAGGKENAAANAFVAFVESCARIVDRFGWPGAFLLLAFGFTVLFASPEQKREIIDLYVLGKGLGNAYPIGIMGILTVVVILAQRKVYKDRISVQQTEIDRLSAWKTEHQQKNIETDLHHSDDDNSES